MLETRKCNVCKVEKPLNCFGATKTQCLDCRKEKARVWYEQNKEAAREKRRKYNWLSRRGLYTPEQSHKGTAHYERFEDAKKQAQATNEKNYGQRGPKYSELRELQEKVAKLEAAIASLAK